MKIIALAAAALMLTAGMASAAPGGKYGHKGYASKKGSHVVRHVRGGRLTAWERMKIARSRAHLAKMRRRARRDGFVSRRERLRLRAAQARHRALVRRERRD